MHRISNILVLFVAVFSSLVARSLAADLQWRSGPGYRSATIDPGSGNPGFSRLSPKDTGINFTNLLSRDRSLTNTPSNNGSGVAVADVDGDGWCDIYFCGLENSNVLYRNLGNWKFEDITVSAGIACTNQLSTGAAFADLNGDGFPDLLVNSLGGGTRAFLNDGKGRFREITDEAGLRSRSASMGLALADIDGDGDLDLYVTNYRTTTLIDEIQTRFSLHRENGKLEIAKVNGVPISAPELKGRFTISQFGAPVEHGEPDVLYLNDGKGHFTAVLWTEGAFLDENGKPISIPYDWGLGVILRDLNGDGSPDLYVCNDSHSEDHLWLNDGHGKFHAIARTALRHTSLSSMGIDVADINRDGFDDFMVLDMFSRSRAKRLRQTEGVRWMQSSIGEIENRPQYPRNALFLNRGDGTFAEIAALAGVESSEWSWTPTFLDVDLDGFEDLLISNGFPYDVRDADANTEIQARKASAKLTPLEEQKLRSLFPPYHSRSLAFKNMGDLTFSDSSEPWGFHDDGIAQGLALADLDNDGDLDLVVNNLNGSAGIYRNNGSAPRLAVRLKGLRNIRGIGSKITVRGGPVIQTASVSCGGRYLSGDDSLRVFAAGHPTHLQVDVLWQNGKRSSISNVIPNQIIEIEENEATESPIQPPQKLAEETLFEDASALLNHTHVQEPFDDFENQPLLPRSLTRRGPGVVWFDWDGDGFDDLFIGAGRGGSAALFRNNGGHGFAPLQESRITGISGRDQTGTVAWRDASGFVLAHAFSNYDQISTNAASFSIIHGTNASLYIDQSIGMNISGLCAGDVDGDGTIDLFVCGSAVPGRYPAASPSMLCFQKNGVWKADTVNQVLFSGLGLVSQALFCDIDGDGDLDLLAACELGPVRCLINERGVFRDASAEWGTAPRIGWWNSIAVGDFDGDGRLDFVAGNWGRNFVYAPSDSMPFHIYAGDFDHNGAWENIEATQNAEGIFPVRNFKLIRSAWPSIQDRFKTVGSFADASVADILGQEIVGAAHYMANTCETTLFLNRTNHFETHPLPVEAQFSPVFGLAVADFNGDGNEDVFLAQNFFATRPDDPRQDAGRGLLLLGNGKGNLAPVAGQHSGIRIYGEQRGAAAADYDHDGRVDLVVAQNGASTVLLHNRTARPGMTVHLAGESGNATGVGAVIQLEYAAGLGPARLVSAGSGYWSQNSSVEVLGMRETPVAVIVQWLGGNRTKSKLPANAREIEVSPSGALRTIR